MVAVASGGRQTGETPGFARLAWRAGEFPLSYRESLVQWVMTHDEVIRSYQEGISARRVSPSAPRSRRWRAFSKSLLLHREAAECFPKGEVPAR